jgi:hypothetical protein
VSERPGRLARQQQRRRRREQLGGIAVAGLGVVVLVVALLALGHPHGQSSAAGTIVRTVTSTVAPPKTSAAAHSSSSASSGASSSDSSASGSTSSSGSSDSSGSGKLPLVVLNNTTISHLAEQAATEFQAGGWSVTKYANYTNNIISTCAYYDPSVSGAQAAAQALQAQFPAIKRIEPQFSELSTYSSPLVVILTPDFTG